MPLSGGLKVIADAATEFPKAFQDMQKVGEWGPYSVMDLLVGLGSAGAGLHNPLLLGGVAARPLARAALKSKAYQNVMTKAPEASKARLPGWQAAGALSLETDMGQANGP
jgi:hypothetical protein